VKAVFSRFLALVFCGAVLGSPALHAQITATTPQGPSEYTQRIDVSGAAFYTHFNPGQAKKVPAINLLGGEGSATIWFRPLWGIEASVREASGTMQFPAAQVNGIQLPTSAPMREYLFLFGPSFRLYRRPKLDLGMHSLVGAAYGSFSSGFPSGIQPESVGIYNDKLAMGLAIGGFADYNLNSRWSVRLTTDWQPTHYGFGWQNESADSVGIVYKFGMLRK
jgi:opacity protein-like surface antigen